MQSETGFPSSHQLKSYVASMSRLKLAVRAVLSADAGLLVENTRRRGRSFATNESIHISGTVTKISTKFDLHINDVTFNHATRAILLFAILNITVVDILNFRYKPYLLNGLRYHIQILLAKYDWLFGCPTKLFSNLKMNKNERMF